MKKHLNYFWLKSFQNNQNSKSIKTFFYLSNELLTSYDKHLVKNYLESVTRNINFFKKNKSIIVIPDILSLFSLDSTFDYTKTITRYQLNEEIKKITKFVKSEDVEIYLEIDISQLHSYRKSIDEMLSQKNFEEKNLSDKKSFLDTSAQFKRRPKLYDFLDTETINLNNYSETDDSLHNELELLINYFEKEYGTNGIIFNSLNRFLSVNDINEVEQKMLNFKSIISKIEVEKNITFSCIYSYSLDSKLISKIISLNIFKNVVLKLEDDYLRKSNHFFQLIETWSDQNVLLWMNPHLININFENISKTSYYHFDLFNIVLTWLIIYNKSIFITWPFFQEIIDSFKFNSFEILENKYLYEQKLFLNNMKTEDIIMNSFKKCFDLFFDPQNGLFESKVIKISPLNVFSSLKKYIIFTNNKTLKIIFNLTDKKHSFFLSKNYSIVYCSSNYDSNFIKPFQFVILEKNKKN